MRRRPIKNIFAIRIPRLYMSHTAHVFTSKNIFWRGFLAMKYGFCDHTCTYKPKFMGENETYQTLTCIWSKERPCLFCFFRSATVFLVIFWDRACIYKRNYLSRNFCFVFVCSIWHAIISTQKYILTRVSTHGKRVWWPYMVSIITDYDQVRNQKLVEKLKHQGFSSIFQMHVLS